jgi:hypothetical protein
MVKNKGLVNVYHKGLYCILANLNPNLNRKKFYYPGVKV